MWHTKHGAPLRPGSLSSVPAAGNAFCQAAQLHLQLQNKHDAATCFVDAGNAFKKADPQGEGPWALGLAARSTSRALCGEVLRFPRAPVFSSGRHAAGWQGGTHAFISELAPCRLAFLSRSKPPPPPSTVCAADRSPPEAWEHLGVGVTFQTHRMPRGEENLFCCQN